MANRQRLVKRTEKDGYVVSFHSRNLRLRTMSNMLYRAWQCSKPLRGHEMSECNPVRRGLKMMDVCT